MLAIVVAHQFLRTAWSSPLAKKVGVTPCKLEAVAETDALGPRAIGGRTDAQVPSAGSSQSTVLLELEGGSGMVIMTY